MSRCERGPGPVMVAPSKAVIVAPDSTLRDLLVQIATRMGIQAHAVASRDAVISAVARDGRPDLIIAMSVVLPELMEIGFLAPTIAISDLAARFTADELGMVCMLPLVFDLSALEGAIRQCLKAQRA